MSLNSLKTKVLIGFLSLMALCFVFPQNMAAKNSTKALLENLKQQLREADNPKDSIRILYNLYDVNSALHSEDEASDTNEEYLNQLFNAGIHNHDTIAAFDALRYLSSVKKYDITYVNNLLNRLAEFPNTTKKQDTQAYLRLQRYFWALRDTTLSENQRRKNFSMIKKEIDRNKGAKSTYDRLDQQFALVLYGSNLIEPDQMDKYLDDLRILVETINDHRSQIKSYYFRTAAMLYDENDNGLKAVEADRQMLKILNQYDSINSNTARQYKNYDVTRFTVYRRMLSNYRYLSKDSVVAVYKELHNLFRELPKDQVTDMDRLSVEAMWDMFNQNYKEALPALRTLMTAKRFNTKPNYIKGYIRAAVALNEFEDVKKGQDAYINLIIDRAKDAADTEYTRLRIEYQIDTIEANSALAAKRAAEANKNMAELSTEVTNYSLLGVGIFLFLIIIIQIIASRRRKLIARQLRETNQSLMNERNALNIAKADLEEANAKARQALQQRTDFVHTVSHEISEPAKNIVGFTQLIVDSIPEERRKYLEGFINIVEYNGNILQRVVGDILDSAEIDDNIVTLAVRRFNPEKVCQTVADSFRPRLSPSQSIEVEPLKVIGNLSGDEIGIDSDPTRLEQILINLMSNAVKFCENGKITVSPVVDLEKGEFSVAVTDQGPGIPEGKEEVIFQRFERLGRYTSGLGLGLFICKQLARILEGDITLDTLYKEGARFVLTIPISIRSAVRNIELK